MNYRYARCFPTIDNIRVFINDEEVQVLNAVVAGFVEVTEQSDVIVKVIAPSDFNNYLLSPLNYKINCKAQEKTLTFELKDNQKIYLEADNLSLPLLIFKNNTCYKNINATYHYKSGQIYETGKIELKDNESLYIESGAIVHGYVYAKNASNIKIFGNGVLDGSYLKTIQPYNKTILLEGCKNVELKDLTIINPTSWITLLGACENVHIDNLKEIGYCTSSDGIDICGSKNILIENSIFKVADDAIVLKAFDNHDLSSMPWNLDVENIRVTKCVFIKDKSGAAFEIGYELMTSAVHDVKFYDNDVVCVHSFGAPFSIHLGDRANIYDITYENIRVQHYYDKLIDIKIIDSRWNVDKIKGQISDINFKDIDVALSEYNVGYSISTIGGLDKDHIIDNITFDNFKLGGKKVLNIDDLDLYTKNVKNIKFK